MAGPRARCSNSWSYPRHVAPIPSFISNLASISADPIRGALCRVRDLAIIPGHGLVLLVDGCRLQTAETEGTGG